MQIWWKGDPGVENFMIKFQNEETMKKWAVCLDLQRKQNAAPAQTEIDQPMPNFAWIQGGPAMENPYAQQDDDDEDDTPYATPMIGGPTPAQYGGVAPVTLPGTMQRNGSSTSLRQRSMTGESAQSLASIARAPAPRYPLPQPPTPLSVQTQMGGSQSPAPRGGESYFSPVAESPASSRTSTTSGFGGYPFPKTITPQPSWGPEDNNRYTAPAMPRAPSRDGPSPVNAYGMRTNNPRGPSMPVMPRDSAQMQAQMQQQRSRSYSTPDINGQANGTRGQAVPAVPGIPAHLYPSHPTHVRHDSNIPRSSAGSPANELPLRTNTNSPGSQRNKQYGGTMAQFPAQPVYPRQGTPGSMSNMPPQGPPPMGLAPLAPSDVPRSVPPSEAVPPTPDIIPLPTQLKVKVNCEGGNYVTLVVTFNITYQSLIDRIDAKLARFTNSGIGKGNLRLRYRDEDGDFVMIESDDDIQIAISDWREGAARNVYPQGVGEIELFCVGVM